MTSHVSLAEEILRLLREIWTVDESRVVPVEDGFDWWPGSYRQAVRVVPFQEDDGVPHCRLQASTDYLADLPIEAPDFAERLNPLLRMSSTFALTVPPRVMCQEIGIPPKARLVSHVYVNDKNKEWLVPFFSGMAALQPIDAQIRAAKLPPLLDGGRADTSIPPGKSSAPEPHHILWFAEQEFAPAGAGDSAWDGALELDEIERFFGNACLVTGDAKGATIEIPFGRDTALLQLLTEQRHPWLGAGLLSVLMLPYVTDRADAIERACYYNYLEAMGSGRTPLFGSWTAVEASGFRCAHSCFIPNLLHRRGIATNLAGYGIRRAHWVRTEFLPETQDERIDQIYVRRFGPAMPAGDQDALMKALSKYSTVGQWFEAAREGGWNVPLELCRGVEQCMEREQLSFADAFTQLVKEEKILFARESLVFDLGALR